MGTARGLLPLLLLAALAGPSVAGDEDRKSPPKTEGLAWFKARPQKATLVLASEDTILLRKKRQITAYSLTTGDERWKGELMLKSVELEVEGELVLERLGGQGLRVRDLHQGTAVELNHSVTGFAAGPGSFYLGRKKFVEARTIQGETLWTYPKESKREKGKLGWIFQMESCTQGLIVSGRTQVECLSEAGKRRWVYSLKEPEQVLELVVDEGGVVVRTATHLHFVDGKRGKRRARLLLPKGAAKLKRGNLRGIQSKRGRTLVLTVPRGEEAASHHLYDLKGRLRAEDEGLVKGCEEGPGFQVLVRRSGSYRVLSPAGRKLFEGSGSFVPTWGGQRESYLLVEGGDEVTGLKRLEPKRGKVALERRLDGKWRLLQVPGALVARQGKTLRLLDATTLDDNSKATLPAVGARLLWSGRTLVFISEGYFGALPTK